MSSGTRLRTLREGKGLSQGAIEKSTGLLRCYISRIENGHTIPSLDTIARVAGALDIPLDQLFYSGDGETPAASTPRGMSLDDLAAQPGKAGEDARFMMQFRNVMGQLGEPDRDVLLALAKKLATR